MVDSSRTREYNTNGGEKQALKQAWGEWLTALGDANGGWDWWVTLTFKPVEPKYKLYQERSGLLYQGKSIKVLDSPGRDKVGWKYSESACDAFFKGIVMRDIDKRSQEARARIRCFLLVLNRAEELYDIFFPTEIICQILIATNDICWDFVCALGCLGLKPYFAVSLLPPC